MKKHFSLEKVAGLIFGTLIALMVSFVGFSQDEKKIDVSINTNKGGQWYTQPWVWIVGAAVFILLLVAIIRGGGSKKE